MKKAHRSAKRSREDSDYHIKDQARLARLNSRLTSTQPSDEAIKDNRPEFAEDLGAGEMPINTDSNTDKKVSTHGRDVGRHRKRQQARSGASFNGRKGGNRKK